MKQNMLNKKSGLKPGEIVSLKYDRAFKIMYGDENHIEILTMLLSKILEVDYNDLEGNITLLPLNVSNQTIGEKRAERDVVVSVKTDDEYRIILEVNVKKDFYESVINRNIYYTFDVSKKVLEGEDYINIDITFLVNFNTFFINSERKKVFDEYLLRNEEGDILTKKYKVLNINIEECYNLWYDNKYQGKFGLYEEDLMLLCASMCVEKEEDFRGILELVRMKPEIKKLIEGVLDNMNKDSDLVSGYYNWKEENDKMNRSIINEVKEKSIQEGIKRKEKEVVINMYKKKYSVEEIGEIIGLSFEQVTEIINIFKDDIN